MRCSLGSSPEAVSQEAASIISLSHALQLSCAFLAPIGAGVGLLVGPCLLRELLSMLKHFGLEFSHCGPELFLLASLPNQHLCQFQRIDHGKVDSYSSESSH